MNRYQKVLQILNFAVGGPTAPVGFHGAFWRGLSRDEFVAKKVLGLQLVIVGDGANSTLVKALKGDTPFGADSGNPNADFNRMPSGRPAVAEADVEFIEKWIDEGCLDDDVVPEAQLSWRRTNAPVASSRTDDIWFIDPKTGRAVNSDEPHGAFISIPAPKAESAIARLRQEGVIADAREGLLCLCPDILNSSCELREASERTTRALRQS